MTEAEFGEQVRALVKMCPDLLSYHTFSSKRSAPGFPDWVICGPRGVIFRELKTDKGRLSPAQKEWIAMLTTAGQDAGVWRLAGLGDGTIWRELRALIAKNT